MNFNGISAANIEHRDLFAVRVSGEYFGVPLGKLV